MTEKKIHTLLKSIHIKPLTTEEKIRAWDQIRFGMAQSTAAATSKYKQETVSPFKKWAYVAVVFGLTTSSVFAAESSKPGDLLYPVDRAWENVQLTLSPASQQNTLKMNFALERVEEVREILKEVAAQRTATSIKKASLVLTGENNTITTTSISKAQTEEITKPENEDGVLSGVTTTATTTEVIGTTTTNTTLSNDNKKRIETALGTALSYLGDTKEEMVKQGDKEAVSYINFMFDQLNDQIETLPNDTTFNVDLSQSKKTVAFEVVSKDNKTTVQATVPENQNATSTENAKKTEPVSTKKIEIKDNSLNIIGKEIPEKPASSTEATSTND
jgi:hypothetical protein